ncbi:MAG: hypothetical protein IJZ59_01950 [Alphaproteobacteria bacterium]|nr:hypothetical protein [Alphaproteobacteria bacterium]
MLFQIYKVHENKLSEQLADDNPYKKKLIAMETPKEKHPIYSTLVFSLLAYCWVFLGIMLIKHLYGNLFSIINLIFVSCCVAITYKKDYLTGINPKYRRNLYIIYFLIFCFSWTIAVTDYGSASYKEIFDLLLLRTINHKSYVALALISYITLGISMSFYRCPYELYRVFYSLQKTYSFYKNDNTIIKRNYPFVFFLIITLPILIYIVFNEMEGEDLNMMKMLSFPMICYPIQYCTCMILARKYFKNFKQ